MITNAKDIKFRCSSLGHIMSKMGLTEKQTESLTQLQEREKLTDKQRETMNDLLAKRDNMDLPEGVKTHLIDVFVSARYERRRDFENKFTAKGNIAEEDSITLYSRLKKEFFAKNEETLSNDWISGTPDLFCGKTIREASQTIDTKTNWDANTFFRDKFKEVKDAYYWQGMGYMDLTGADQHTVAHCLVNTPYSLVQWELHRESYKYLNADTPTWIELQIIANLVYDRKTFEEYVNLRGCLPIDLNSKAVFEGFVDIPMEERMFELTVDRDDKEIKWIYDRVELCREWMNTNLFKLKLMLA